MPPKGKIKYEWNKIRVFINQIDLETFIRNDSYRSVIKNGPQKYFCNECQDVITHHMLVSYRYCSSVKCHEKQGDCCPYKYKIHKCEQTGAFHLYESNSKHLDINVDSEDQPVGLHCLMKEEIMKCYNQRIRKPMDICITLTTNQVNNKLYEGIQLPTAKQISRQIAKIKNPNDDDDEFSRVEALMNSLMYQGNKYYEPNQAFCFGVKLGDGSEQSHFIANFTSLKLLEVISIVDLSVTDLSIYHIDETYKITKNRFPLVVIGRSDHNGTFYPICISLVSHGQAIDFINILQSLKELCLSLNISFQPTCFLQDACLASKIGIETVFKSCQILMCWFHVIQNVKRQEKIIPNNEYNQVMQEINNMHYSKSIEEYNTIKNEPQLAELQPVRSIQPVESQPSSEPMETQIVKKKRGRPPKILNGEDEVKSKKARVEEQVLETKRGPGRPRKARHALVME